MTLDEVISKLQTIRDDLKTEGVIEARVYVVQEGDLLAPFTIKSLFGCDVIAFEPI